MSSNTKPARLDKLKKELDQADSRLRALRGKHRNRNPAVDSALPDLASELEAQTRILFELLERDLQPAPRKALLEREERIRTQALDYLQKSKVDPKLWTDLASS